MLKIRFALCFLSLLYLLCPSALGGEDPLPAVGFGEIDITPDVKSKHPVWIAGYGMNRRAEGVHDPLFARGVVLKHGESKLALVSVDLVGLQYPAVKRIREKLADFDYVMISSTHNHEGPDVVGIWGPSPLTSGVDPDYLELIQTRVIEMIRRAEKELAPVQSFYGTARDETLLEDARLPHVYDDVLRTVRFTRPGQETPAGIVVQWNCHPEALGSKNKLLSADFVGFTVEYLKKKHRCPVVYFTGTVGGLMTVPEKRAKDASGASPPAETFDYTRLYGEEVGRLTDRALAGDAPLRLTPFKISAKPIYVPLENLGFRAYQLAGVLRREGYLWSGDLDRPGEAIAPAAAEGKKVALQSEVAYLRLGELHAACIPGEIYPELVYGTYQDPVDPGADYPDAALEPAVMPTLPGEKKMLFGLANDEIGYILPKRQWDVKAPYAYGRKSSQYGEVNSVGVEAGPVVTQALQRRVREAQ